MERVLIAGGSGSVGRVLTQTLQNADFEVAWLSRTAADGRVKRFQWNPKAGNLDGDAILWADHIIHLAGADVSEKRWTASRKQEIYDSRVKTAAMLVEAIAKVSSRPKTLLSMSAVGIYGDGGEAWQTEETHPGSGFLAEICVAWEQAVQPVTDLGVRLITIRAGLVLLSKGGLLEPFKLPIKLGIGPYFGNGRQFYPWIHVADVAGIFLHALQHSNMHGAYNAVAPDPLRNKEFVRAIATGMGKRVLLVPTPAFAMRLAMGARGRLPFMSNRVSSQKVQEHGYQFLHTDMERAVEHLMK